MPAIFAGPLTFLSFLFHARPGHFRAAAWPGRAAFRHFSRRLIAARPFSPYHEPAFLHFLSAADKSQAFCLAAADYLFRHDAFVWKPDMRFFSCAEMRRQPPFQRHAISAASRSFRLILKYAAARLSAEGHYWLS